MKTKRYITYYGREVTKAPGSGTLLAYKRPITRCQFQCRILTSKCAYYGTLSCHADCVCLLFPIKPIYLFDFNAKPIAFLLLVEISEVKAVRPTGFCVCVCVSKFYLSTRFLFISSLRHVMKTGDAGGDFTFTYGVTSALHKTAYVHRKHTYYADFALCIVFHNPL